MTFVSLLPTFSYKNNLLRFFEGFPKRINIPDIFLIVIRLPIKLPSFSVIMSDSIVTEIDQQSLSAPNDKCDLNGNILPETDNSNNDDNHLENLKNKFFQSEQLHCGGDVKSVKTTQEAVKSHVTDNGNVENKAPNGEHVSKSKNEDELVEEKLDASETEVEDKDQQAGASGGGGSSGIEGTSDISDTPLTDTTTNKDDNEVATKETSAAKKKKIRVKVTGRPHSANSSHRYRNDRNGYGSDRRDNGHQYNNWHHGSNVPGALGGFIRSFQRQNGNYNGYSNQMSFNNRVPRNNFNGGYPNHGPRYDHGPQRINSHGYYNNNRFENDKRFDNNRYDNGSMNRSFQNSGYQGPKPYVSNPPFPVLRPIGFNNNNNRGANGERDSDRCEELVKTIDYNDNGNVINIKASLAPSALTKLKEQSSFQLKVRLPATTPLSVVKRVLCAKFYLTKMMYAAKNSTG